MKLARKHSKRGLTVPETATKLLFVNNGLTSLTEDDENRGKGFNLNLLCLMLKDKAGKQHCYHLDKIKDPKNDDKKLKPFDSSPTGW